MNPHLSSTRDILLSIESAMQMTIIWQDDLIRWLIIALFARGHVLIEWVPGLGKTKAVKTLASVLGYDFKRVSFTPDLLPSDITWHEMYRKETGKFEVRKWPIFTNILLADEINRTPPKVQSALLEAMEEHQVTIGEKSLELPKPFFVIATENPLEHEGTYPLPEAELDRFLMKIIIDYPKKEDEKTILMQSSLSFSERESLGKRSSLREDDKKIGILSADECIEIASYIQENIKVDEKIYDYISDILEMTRTRKKDSPPYLFEGGKQEPSKQENIQNALSYGASTRAGLALVRGARVRALLEWRDYVTPEDIKSLAPMILRHRIGLSYEAMAKKISPDMVIGEILSSVRVP